MNIIVCNDKKEFDQKAAQILASQIQNKPDSVLGLATGGTPVGMYQELIKMYENKELSFEQVKTFNLDEYVGLDKDHPQSYHAYMYENLFNHVDIKKENVNLPDGRAEDLEQECAAYEQKIKEAGGIDLQVLGIGHNGHIGFNEPNTPFQAVTHVVDLDERTIQANSRFFDSIDEVPRKAISMGIKSIMQAKKIMLMATGADKAEIIAKALQGPVTPEVPASVLQLHPNVTVVLDKEAASKLSL